MVRGGILAAVVAVATGCSHLWVGSPYEDRETEGARLVVKDGVALVEVGGSPGEIGRALGSLLAGEIEDLSDEILGGIADGMSASDLEKLGDALATTLEPDHQAELRAMAGASGVAFHRLVLGTVLPDMACSALAAWGSATKGGELAVARNMDFYPASVLGAYTLVTVVRPRGKHAYASVGWPGFGGVASGLNDRGVAAFLLLNWDLLRSREDGAEPIAFRVKSVLEQADDLDEAIAILTREPVWSGHYVLLADSRSAITVYQYAGEFRFLRPEGEILVATNESVDDDGLILVDDGFGLQTGERADLLYRIAADHLGTLDDAVLRRAIGASYLRYINAQAMVALPARRVLQLALGTTLSPASRGDWHEIELGPALGGESIDETAVREIEDAGEPFEHYRDARVPQDPARWTARRRARLTAAAAIEDPVTRLELEIDVADRIEDSPALFDFALERILTDLDVLASTLRRESDRELARELRQLVERTEVTFEGRLEPEAIERIEAVRAAAHDREE